MNFYVTSNFLRDHGACQEQYRLFEDLFPKGATLTRDNVRKAHENGLFVDWLFEVLNDNIYDQYEAEYRALNAKRNARLDSIYNQDAALKIEGFGKFHPERQKLLTRANAINDSYYLSLGLLAWRIARKHGKAAFNQHEGD